MIEKYLGIWWYRYYILTINKSHTPEIERYILFSQSADLIYAHREFNQSQQRNLFRNSRFCISINRTGCSQSQTLISLGRIEIPSGSFKETNLRGYVAQEVE